MSSSRRLISAALIASLSGVLLMGPPASAVPCGPANLTNGSFEDYTLDTPPYASMGEPSVIGNWMNDWGVPEHFLFLDLDEAPQALPGWETTNTDNIVELQRQVSGSEQDGSHTSAGYFDSYAVQPAEGDHWAELNSTQEAALYQDVTLEADVEYTWSIKHRGRVFAADGTDEMKVLIGPASGSLTQQTSIKRFDPTNADVFVGEPTYSNTSTDVTQIRGNIDDGWVMYRGTFTPDTSGDYRFQFEAVDGWAPTVGNMLDDIEFAKSECVSDPAGSGGGSGGGGDGRDTEPLAATGPTRLGTAALAAIALIAMGGAVVALRRNSSH